jgi:2-dehydro-3-deoxygluconokinase
VGDKIKRVVCVGEAMVEMSTRQGRWDVHYGGDTLNVALHLTRLGHDVSYLTALGGDPFAGFMRQAWAREGLDVSHVLAIPERTTGLYCIDTDERGERHFHYWRGESAARSLFLAPGIDQAMEAAYGADLLFFSLITLAILPDEARELVLRMARNVRLHRGKVAFDSNFRPALWESVEAARKWRDRAAEVANFGLPSLEDEQRLGLAADAAEIRDHWLKCGCEEVVVKLGPAGAMLPDGTLAKPEVQLHALDTSGAGDAFDAGYLGARLRGASPEQAAAHGQRLAGWTVMRQGAIPERDHAAPYLAMTASNELAPVSVAPPP